MATPIDPATPGAGVRTELMTRFTAFLDSDNGRGALVNRLQHMVSPPDEETLRADQFPKRLIVSLDELRDFDTDLANDLMQRPVEHLPVFENAMYELITGMRQDLAHDKRKLSQYRIGLDGEFGSRHVSPRGLNATFVGGVVKVEGIVTRASVVRPRLVLSVHYCPITKRFHEKTFRDNASVSSLAMFTQNVGMPGSSYPTRDEEGNPLQTEFGRCWYTDSQRLTIQEMPEKSPPGQLPRSIDVLIEGDLCDVCKPGDRVNISGIFRAVGGAAATSGSALFSTFLVANHISLLSGAEDRTSVDNSIHEDDIRNFIEFASKGRVLDRMGKSIAPSICGHDYIKRAILLFLIGGRERNLTNGTHLRGDLNMLMVGDPSTAKSQLLRFVLNTAPLAVSTTGRGSSGVGLTAAVTTDQDTGDRHLEAGAMVLADRGVVCIDEFDKMSDEDRVAIHEVMEQQTVTISKAGIHASLNARCSVIAAANPVWGSYDQHRPPQDNIALPDSLLSRFDLLFIVLDTADKNRDRSIADHVLRGHCFRYVTDTLDERDDDVETSRTADGTVGDSEIQATPMYESAASALYTDGAAAERMSTRRRSARSEEDKILSTKFLKQYISYAKHRVRPTLTSDAAELIASVYQGLRQNEDSKTQHITARCLETLIRLATAHAKLRLDKSHVTRDDAMAAAEVLRFALFNQAEPDKSEKVFRRRSRRMNNNGGADGNNDDDDDDDDDDDKDGGDSGRNPTSNDNATNGTTTGTDDTANITDSAENDEEAKANGLTEEDIDEIQPAVPTRRGQRRRQTRQSETDSGRALPESAEDMGGSQGSAKPLGADSMEPVESESMGDASQASGARKTRSSTTADVHKVKQALNRLRSREGTVQLDQLVEAVINDGMNRAEASNALDDLQLDDVVVVADGEIFIV